MGAALRDAVDRKSGIVEQPRALEEKKLFRSICPSHNEAMTELLDRAVTTARGLPPETQDEIARMVLAFVGDDHSIYQFSPEEEAELDESEAAAARGDFATDDEVRAIWAKHGL